MTFLEAAVEVLRREGKPLHFKELTRLAIKFDLLSVVGREPDAMMQTRLQAEVRRPTSELVRTSPGVFGLRSYPARSSRESSGKAETAPSARSAGGAGTGAQLELPAGEAGAKAGATKERGRRRGRGGRGDATAVEAAAPAVVAAPEAVVAPPPAVPPPVAPAPSSVSSSVRPAAAAAPAGPARGNRRRRGGRGGQGADAAPATTTEVVATAPAVAVEPPVPVVVAEPVASPAVLPAVIEVTAAVPAAPVVEITPAAVVSKEEPVAAPTPAVPAPVAVSTAPVAPAPARSATTPAPRPSSGQTPVPATPPAERHRSHSGHPAGERRAHAAPASGATPVAGSAQSPAAGRPVATPVSAATPAPVVSGAAAPAQPVAATGGAAQPAQPAQPRLMTYADAAYDVLRGSSEGRALNFKQIAEIALKRRLVRGELPDVARALRAALVREQRQRDTDGLRPRIRSVGSGQYMLSERKLEPELYNAERELLDRLNRTREATRVALRRRLRQLPPGAFELLMRLLMERLGMLGAELIKRGDGVAYYSGQAPRGNRSVKVLVAVRPGEAELSREAVGELRAGVRLRGFDEGMLLCAGRPSAAALTEVTAAPGIDLYDQDSLTDLLVRQQLGIRRMALPIDYLDVELFGELVEQG